MLHIIYRSYGGENMKGRPDYYSKLVALASLIRSFRQLQPDVAELIFLNDGPIPRDRLQLMERSGEVLARSNLGMRGSMRSALKIPILRGWPPDDLVWFSEDDYLYLPRAMQDLIAAAAACPDVAYFGLYALIGSRLPSGRAFETPLRVPRQWSGSDTTLVCGHPWRQALSTTSTFGAKVRPVIEDRMMMQIAMQSGSPWDHTTSLMYQGFTPYPAASLIEAFQNEVRSKSWLRRAIIFNVRMCLNAYQAVRGRKRSTHRLLVAPDPALATHLETIYLAEGTDWRSVARDTLEWLDAERKTA